MERSTLEPGQIYEDEKGKRIPLWRIRSPLAPPAKFDTPEELAESITEYFEWVENNPLQEKITVPFQGAPNKTDMPRLRAMSINAMCVYIGISVVRWASWRTERPDLLPVIRWAESTIFSQKFEGASAGLLNASIIARDLGLADKKELSGPKGKPIETVSKTMTAAEAAAAYQAELEAEEDGEGTEDA